MDLPLPRPDARPPSPCRHSPLGGLAKRQRRLLVRLRAGQENIRDMVSVMYADVDKRLHPAAAHSVLAHMIHLVETNRVICDGAADLQARYSLPVPA